MGDYLKKLSQRGFKQLNGIEPEPVNENNEGFTILDFNLTKELFLDPKGNIVCLEVGEHIPQAYTQKFLDNIQRNCDNYLILSWAVKGQGGYGHFNELDNEEVIKTIQSMGFDYLEKESMDARSNVEDFCAYFRNTLMIFKKQQ